MYNFKKSFTYSYEFYALLIHCFYLVQIISIIFDSNFIPNGRIIQRIS